MEKVLIVDFGSRSLADVVKAVENRAIAYTLLPWKEVEENFDKSDYKGIILSGSPHSVYEEDAPSINKEVFERGIPTLGICYGFQLISKLYGANVHRAEHGEKVLTEIEFLDSLLFKGLEKKNYVEMRHVDRAYEVPQGFVLTAKTKDCPIAGIENMEKSIYAVQFHPELGGCGDKVLDNFLYGICNIKRR